MQTPSHNNSYDADKKSDSMTPDFPPLVRRVWSWKKRLLVGAGVMIAMIAASMGGAEYYTAKPTFCRSCHVMETYYQSWSHDVHSTKLGVRCVDCHYAPGERHTIHAKFKGLSQMASYFSGRYGSSRPRAHVNEASCLVSECHGDHKFMDKKLPIGEVRTEKRIIAGVETEVKRTPTVTFVHSKHLEVGSQLTHNNEKLEQVTAKLQAAVPAEVLTEIKEVVASVEPMTDRQQKLAQLLTGHKLEAGKDDAAQFLELSDMGVRLEQLSGLSCASCHSYDGSGQQHFAVDRQSCYTCHFTNQKFNGGSGRCLTCHTPPTRQIVIHGAPATQGAGASIMNHQDILDRKIDCASCHLDVVQGGAAVTERECAHCHDQTRYLKNFATRTAGDVEEYHRIHVAAQRARCPDCHGATRHQLIEPTLVATSAGFLKPIIDQCQHCHPKHHDEQVKLLMGVGGPKKEPAMPNAMFGSRVNCRACHQKPGEDFKGDPLIQATADTCVSCHEKKYGDLLRQWLQELDAYLAESEKALAQVKQRVEQYRSKGGKVPSIALELLSEAEQEIHLVKIGNGIHNRNYATHLLDMADDDLRAAQKLLAE